MFSLSVVCTLNTQLKVLPCTVLRQTINGNFNLTPTVNKLVMEACFEGSISSFFYLYPIFFYLVCNYPLILQIIFVVPHTPEWLPMKDIPQYK